MPRFSLIAVIILVGLAGGAAERFYFSRDRFNSNFRENNRQHAYFYDSQDRERLDMGMYNGQPIQDFLAEDRTPRLQVATYTNDVRSDEEGLPVMTLYNSMASLKELLRLDGFNQSPLVIMKDNVERNRIIMGLGLSDAGEEPFFVYFTNDDKKHMLFGKF